MDPKIGGQGTGGVDRLSTPLTGLTGTFRGVAKWAGHEISRSNDMSKSSPSGRTNEAGHTLAVPQNNAAQHLHAVHGPSASPPTENTTVIQTASKTAVLGEDILYGIGELFETDPVPSTPERQEQQNKVAAETAKLNEVWAKKQEKKEKGAKRHDLIEGIISPPVDAASQLVKDQKDLKTANKELAQAKNNLSNAKAELQSFHDNRELPNAKRNLEVLLEGGKVNVHTSPDGTVTYTGEYGKAATNAQQKITELEGKLQKLEGRVKDCETELATAQDNYETARDQSPIANELKQLDQEIAAHDNAIQAMLKNETGAFQSTDSKGMDGVQPKSADPAKKEGVQESKTERREGARREAAAGQRNYLSSSAPAAMQTVGASASTPSSATAQREQTEISHREEPARQSSPVAAAPMAEIPVTESTQTIRQPAGTAEGAPIAREVPTTPDGAPKTATPSSDQPAVSSATASATQSQAPAKAASKETPTPLENEIRTARQQIAEEKQKLTALHRPAQPVLQSSRPEGQPVTALPLQTSLPLPNVKLPQQLKALDNLDKELEKAQKTLEKARLAETPLPTSSSPEAAPGAPVGAPATPGPATAQEHILAQQQKQEASARVLLQQAQAVVNQSQAIASEELVRRGGQPAAAAAAEANETNPETEERPPVLPAAAQGGAGTGSEQREGQGRGGQQQRQEAPGAPSRTGEPEIHVGEANEGPAFSHEGFTGTVETGRTSTIARLRKKDASGKEYYVTLEFNGPADQAKIKQYLSMAQSKQKIENMMNEHKILSDLGKRDFSITESPIGRTQMTYTGKKGGQDATKTLDVGELREGRALLAKLEKYDAKMETARASGNQERVAHLTQKREKVQKVLSQYKIKFPAAKRNTGRTDPEFVLGQQTTPPPLPPRPDRTAAPQAAPLPPPPPPEQLSFERQSLLNSYQSQTLALNAAIAKTKQARKTAEENLNTGKQNALHSLDNFVTSFPADQQQSVKEKIKAIIEAETLQNSYDLGEKLFQQPLFASANENRKLSNFFRTNISPIRTALHEMDENTPPTNDFRSDSLKQLADIQRELITASPATQDEARDFSLLTRYLNRQNEAVLNNSRLSQYDSNQAIKQQIQAIQAFKAYQQAGKDQSANFGELRDQFRAIVASQLQST